MPKITPGREILALFRDYLGAPQELIPYSTKQDFLEQFVKEVELWGTSLENRERIRCRVQLAKDGYIDASSEGNNWHYKMTEKGWKLWEQLPVSSLVFVDEQSAVNELIKAHFNKQHLELVN